MGNRSALRNLGKGKAGKGIWGMERDQGTEPLSGVRGRESGEQRRSQECGEVRSGLREREQATGALSGVRGKGNGEQRRCQACGEGISGPEAGQLD